MKDPELICMCRNVQVNYINLPLHRLFITINYSKVMVNQVDYINILLELLNLFFRYCFLCPTQEVSYCKLYHSLGTFLLKMCPCLIVHIYLPRALTGVQVLEHAY
jgi:hypothetical protein